jgi:hypothetical protein
MVSPVRPSRRRGRPRHGRRGPQGRVRFYRYGLLALAFLFVGIGIGLLAVTTARGGGAFGYLVGVLFVALGIGRLYLLRARR